MSKLPAKIKEELEALVPPTLFFFVALHLSEANQRMLAEVVWPHFWAIQIFLLVLIPMYCTMRELVRVIGPGRVR
jgi:hypothetical protein